MSLRVLRVGSGLGPEALQRLDMGSDPRPALLAARAEADAIVFVLSEDDLAQFKTCADLIVDRGTRHPARPLHRILLGRKQIPLVHVEYVVLQRFLSSVRELRARALRQGDLNLFLIAVSPGLFTQLWNAAAPGDPKAVSEPRQRLELTVRVEPNPLIALLPPLPLPDAVLRGLVGASSASERVRQSIMRAAGHLQPVLLLGETGTGKDVTARLIHAQSPRSGPFVVADCSVLPRELLEGELFGSVKGSFTDAKETRDGLWMAASGGTLFLDEVGELTLDHQVKLLGAIERGEIRRVGGTTPIKVDVRIIAATNRDLVAMVNAGEFRHDLYHRLHHLIIQTPALRHHPEDIPVSADHFWRKLSGDPGATLPDDVLAELCRHQWPGNNRELLAVLTTLFNLVGPQALAASHVHALLSAEDPIGGRGHGGPPSLAELPFYKVECVRHLRRADQVIRAAQLPLRDAMNGAPVTEAMQHSVTSSTRARIAELEGLCSTPALFHGDPFDVVRLVKNELRTFTDLWQTDPQAALAFWKRVLEPDCALAFRVIVRAIDELIGAGADPDPALRKGRQSRSMRRPSTPADSGPPKRLPVP